MVQINVVQASHDDLWCVTHVSTNVANLLLGMFFGRYPHIHGKDGGGETDTLFENTYRGQGQVDLIMMGAGQHPLPHAR